MINYSKFKILLKKHDINLFDDEYRLLFNNMKILDRICNNENNIKKSTSSNQVGGSFEKLVSPFYILGKSFEKENLFSRKKIVMVVNNLKNNNFDGAKFICKKNFSPKIV
jgi:hypothetical protein|tara:strand:- start:539 stop:868 length:330 start_codon:yes stop_codon:yes gene_type:complete